MRRRPDVDGRDKPGHDDFFVWAVLSEESSRASLRRNNTGVMPNGEALALGARPTRFDSVHPDQHGPLAQSAERLSYKQDVGGADPSRPTIAALRFW
jgi:hypothetical protein